MGPTTSVSVGTLSLFLTVVVCGRASSTRRSGTDEHGATSESAAGSPDAIRPPPSSPGRRPPVVRLGPWCSPPAPARELGRIAEPSSAASRKVLSHGAVLLGLS